MDDASVVDYHFLLCSWLLANAFVSGRGSSCMSGLVQCRVVTSLDFSQFVFVIEVST